MLIIITVPGIDQLIIIVIIMMIIVSHPKRHCTRASTRSWGTCRGGRRRGWADREERTAIGIWRGGRRRGSADRRERATAISIRLDRECLDHTTTPGV